MTLESFAHDAISARAYTRSEWLAEKRRTIGASESAAVLGKSPRQTPLQLYVAKLGLEDDAQEDETPELRRGRRLEPLVLADYEDAIGEPLVAKQVFVRHPEYQWMSATLDGVRRDGRPVEAKTVGPWSMRKWGDEGSDFVPAHILIQVHHQLAITGHPVADIPVLFGGEIFRIYTVEADAEFHEILIDRLKEFWRCIETRTPPAPSAGDEQALSRLYPRATGQIDLDGSTLLAVNTFEHYGEQEKDIKERRSLLKSQILAAMGEAQVANLPDGRILKRTVVNVQEHTVKSSSYARFSISKGK